MQPDLPEYIVEERGCGLREMDKIYLIGGGEGWGCHRLPLYLDEPCPVCGEGIRHFKGFRWIDPLKLFHECGETEIVRYEYSGDTPTEIKQCRHCPPSCAICYPPSKAGLMWVGETFYTTDSFSAEAQRIGISKKLPHKPKDLKPGDCVYLAHIRGATKTTTDEEDKEKRRRVPAIFMAFRVQRIEMLIRDSDATYQRLQELREQGIEPVVVSDRYAEHLDQNSRERRQGRDREREALIEQEGAVGLPPSHEEIFSEVLEE